MAVHSHPIPSVAFLAFAAFLAYQTFQAYWAFQAYYSYQASPLAEKENYTALCNRDGEMKDTQKREGA